MWVIGTNKTKTKTEWNDRLEKEWYYVAMDKLKSNNTMDLMNDFLEVIT